jgi:hypothetical protein
MKTGAHGTLVLEDVAEAEYVWSVDLEAGGRADGTVDIAPDRETLLRIEL